LGESGRNRAVLPVSAMGNGEDGAEDHVEKTLLFGRGGKARARKEKLGSLFRRTRHNIL